jgi:hypothetical protein
VESERRAAGLLTSGDRPADVVDLATMTRKHSLRIGAFQNQPAEPFTGSLALDWEWDALAVGSDAHH